MKKIPAAAFLFLLCSFTSGNYTLVSSIPTGAGFFTTDNIGNSYLVTDNQVLKYDTSGKQVSVFSEKNSGIISSVDASNAMKLLVFYRDFAQLLILDQKLSLNTRISLRDIGIMQPMLVCTAANGDLWTYDQQDFQLKRLNSKLEITHESGNLSQLTGSEIKPAYMAEAGDLLYISNPAAGIMVFDSYGSYIKTIPLKNINTFQVIESSLLYFSGGELKSYHLKTFEDKTIALPMQDSTIISARIEKQNLFILAKEKFELYSF